MRSLITKFLYRHKPKTPGWPDK